MFVLTFGGLASGLVRQRSQLTSINSALTSIRSLSSKLGTPQSAAQALSISLGFSSFKTTSSAPSSAAVAPVQGAAAAASMDLTSPASEKA